MVEGLIQSNNSIMNNLNKESIKFDKSKILSTLQKYGPTIFYVSILFFYFSFFLIVNND